MSILSLVQQAAMVTILMVFDTYLQCSVYNFSLGPTQTPSQLFTMMMLLVLIGLC